MIRSIKFRGKKKSPYGDKWVEGYYALQDGEHVIIMPHSDDYKESLEAQEPLPPISASHVVDMNALGQYTGLKDKNGTEIYEGDIVKVILTEFDKYWIGKIKYELAICSYVIKRKGYIDVAFFENLKDIEVIGNIYDNPELIKEE